MMSNQFELYLDESTISEKTTGDSVCSVAGIIVENNVRYNMRKSLGDLKYLLWDKKDNPKGKVLHLTEANAAYHHVNINNSDMRIFSDGEKIRNLYDGIGEIITTYSLPVMGVVYKKGFIEKAYGNTEFKKTAYEVAMQIIVENFTHFLIQNNGTGTIILESRNSSKNKHIDQRVQQLFYTILAAGTLFYPSKTVQDKVLGIKFKSKKDNDAGLQIADFVPIHFAKKVAHSKQLKPNIYQILRLHRYDGERSKPDRYGIKIIP